MKGTVVVVPFPFSDLSDSKRRPALVIADLKGNDMILCQITSQNTKDSLLYHSTCRTSQTALYLQIHSSDPTEFLLQTKISLSKMWGQFLAKKYSLYILFYKKYFKANLQLIQW